jgi:hypothetical protein
MTSDAAHLVPAPDFACSSGALTQLEAVAGNHSTRQASAVKSNWRVPLESEVRAINPLD